MKKAAEDAMKMNPKAVFTVTPPIDGGKVIVGVMCLVENYSQGSTSNKQWWGAKAPELISIFKLFQDVAGYEDLKQFTPHMESVEILAVQYGDQNNRAGRKGAGTLYKDSAIGFVIDGREKVQPPSVLLKLLIDKIIGIFHRPEFKSSYMNIMNATNSGFAGVIERDEKFFKIASNFTDVIDVNPLNKRLPDEEIIKLVNIFTNNIDTLSWGTEIQQACWKDGNPPRKSTL